VISTLREEFPEGPASELAEFFATGTRGFAQERRGPSTPTLKLRIPDTEEANTEKSTEERLVLRAKAG
jgi:hypothetical protein